MEPFLWLSEGFVKKKKLPAKPAVYDSLLSPHAVTPFLKEISVAYLAI